MLYQQWIKHKQRKRNIVSVGIYDIIDNELGDFYGVKEFLKDYIFVTHQKRNVVPFDDDKDDERENGCDIDKCYITKRTERNKGEMTRQNNLRNKIFFVDKKNDDERDIVMQQMLDSLHIFIYHVTNSISKIPWDSIRI